jgi:hypothetical protein
MNRSMSNLFTIVVVVIGGAVALVIALSHHDRHKTAAPIPEAPVVEWHDPGDHPIRAVRVLLHVEVPDASEAPTP